jgi:ascorbate-specific PTS system EIIC-type component UlaA
MPEFCTCGAQLPPDARFCHKCGKPQRESDAQFSADRETPQAVPPDAVVAVDAPAPMPLTFHNPVAIRVGFSVACVAALLTMIPFVNYGVLVWLLGAGFVSVFFYKRRTGQRLSVRSGARMGWITGVLSFAILTVILTLALFAINRMGGFSAVRDQMTSVQMSQKDIDEVAATLQTPTGILRLLASIFVVMTLVPMAGGALGAKLLSKE